MVPETSPLATEAAAPPPMDTDVLLLSLLLPQAVRISARAAVPAIHADRTAWVLVIELRSFLGPCGRGWVMQTQGVDGLAAGARCGRGDRAGTTRAVRPTGITR